ncbi:hypothetical protein [Caulobacter sp. NIBR1757]|uniref:hypothetical protein n=1 Tax=Caulobacter sp. NIBR1757 TaxID=3016000 RepID=UPI0022F14175|nr:hypothetical protein [Caulobacter sp. NIBR1757]WGM40048.1 hypothetical protein AMEJIAPC_02989 [Caulobacter sp. NIBR1757]
MTPNDIATAGQQDAGKTAQGQLDDFLRMVQARCADLERPLRGLEMFARDGSWFTGHIARMVDEMECWEINAKYIPDLERNIPTAKVRQVDSIAHEPEPGDTFGLICLDNPQGIYGDYCEHFEALPRALRILAKTGVLVFYVNLNPYRAKPSAPNDDYGMVEHDAWFERRAAFYGRDAESLTPEFAEQFYGQMFQRLGLTMKSFDGVLFRSTVPGHPDYMFRVVAAVERGPSAA